jgi:endonuclease-8
VPEGHTIHRAARDQRPMLAGRVLAVASPQGRFAAGAASLDGQACRAIEAYGKHLLYDFEGERTLHVHLGLFGSFRSAVQPAPAPRGAVRARLQSATHAVDIVGPNRCEVLDPAARAALLARIGPDVLRADADPARAATRISASRTAIGLLLMDQSVIAGIGNIYRTELLWRAGIHPSLPGARLSAAQFDRLWTDARTLLARGVELGAIVTVDDAEAGRGRYRERVNIFGQETCPRCARRIRLIVLGGRKAYACEACQKRPRRVTARA